MRKYKSTEKPKKEIPNWIDFITNRNNQPAKLQAINNSSGLFIGFQTDCWAMDGDYFAIHNTSGNAVWCHVNNFKILKCGSIKSIQKKFHIIQF